MRATVSSPTSATTHIPENQRNIASLYNFIFFSSAVVVALAVLVKVTFFSSLAPSGRSTSHLSKADQTLLHFPKEVPYSKTLLAEHNERKEILQTQKAWRKLRAYLSTQGSTLEELLSPSLDDLLSTIPPNATSKIDPYPNWNQSEFERIPWEYVSSQKQVDTFVKHVPGSKLLAFRGVSLMENVHISQALGPFVNVTNSLDWVPVLKYIEAVPMIDQTHKTPFLHLQDAHLSQTHRASSSLKKDVDVDHLLAQLQDNSNRWRWTQSDAIYQILRLPWPITPRDLYLYRHFTFDAERRQVTVRYHSLSEEDLGRVHRWQGVENNHTMIRAMTPHTLWRFTAIPDNTGDNLEDPVRSSNAKKQSSTPNTFINDTDNEKSEKGNEARGVSHSSPRHVWLSWKRSLKTIWSQLVSRLRRVSLPWSQQQTKTAVEAKDPVESNVAVQNDGSSGLIPITSCLPLPTDTRTHPPKEESEAHTNKAAAAAAAAAGKTRRSTMHVLVEVETVVDSRGSIPSWFINFMQRQWPSSTLSTFRELALAGKVAPHPGVECW